MASADPRNTFLQLPIARSSNSDASSESRVSHNHASFPPHLSSEEPLDLTVSSRPDGKASCSDCKELRREVREVKNSVQFLIQQFSEFAGRWSNAIGQKGPVSAGSSAQRSSPVSSVSSNESCAKEDSNKRRDVSPESASSSFDSLAIQPKKRKAGSKLQKSKNPVSPKMNEQALPSLRTKDISDTPVMPEIKRPKTEPVTVALSCPLPTCLAQPLPGHSLASQTWQTPQMWNASWNPLLRQAYDSPDFRRHMESSGIKSGAFSSGIPGMGSPSPPSSGGGIPSPSSHSGLTQAQLECVIKNVVAMQQHKRDMEAQKYHQQVAATREEVPLAADIASLRRGETGKPSVGENHLEPQHQNPPLKKRPGPDDFIKEFVEQECFLGDDTERSYQIPVPEALEFDPSFRPVSEEALLCSTRWEELEWQEAVTRLAKKLAEKRVFGPVLMAKATVAGTNHSNYPNLPIQGIMYIESVCRRVLFPGLTRREFAEYFRPAVKGLAARCRRIRHSMKPGGSVDASVEDFYGPEDDEPSSSNV